jgi:tetrahydromethanopterin S-methyltransferase subunit B
MDNVITRDEHKEFALRIQEENTRQNRRIELLEQNTKQIGELTVSVGKLAQSIENMVKEQERHGKRLEVLEGRDGEMWRKVTGYIITAVIGIVIGVICSKIGL